MEKWIVPIVEDAVHDLRAGLRVYWPAEGLNEMAEAQALGAVGRAFARAGFHIFPEASCRGQGRLGHVDLVPISTRRHVCVAVEGKRLYEGRGCSYMLGDWERLGRIRMASKHRTPRVDRHFRMLLTTTWQPNNGSGG